MTTIYGIFYSVQRAPGNKDPGAFYLLCEEGRVTCEGCGWSLRSKTPLLVTGEWLSEESRLFKVHDICFDTVHEKVCTRFLKGRAFTSVGTKTANHLIKELKDTAVKKFKEKNGIISAESRWNELSFDELQDVIGDLGIDPTVMIQLQDAIGGIQERKNIQKIFSDYQPTYRDLELIYQSYYNKALPSLKSRPYDGLSYGISFQVCDQIAAKYKQIYPWDNERKEALLKQLTIKIRSLGSCCIKMEEAVKYLRHIQGSSSFVHMDDAMLMSILFSAKKFVIEDTKRYGVLVYPRSFYYAEKNIVSEINRLNSSMEDLGYQEYRGKSNLDQYQIKAMDFMKTSGVKILYGGPGAGKTTTIQEFINEYKLLRPDGNVFLCAPTGRAAVRITESCHGTNAAVTIHKLLGVKPYTKAMACDMNKENQLPKGLFVLDEMSMTDELLFLKFLEAIPNGSLVILSGDPDQLPSVECGTVLKDLIDSGKLDSVRLKGNHRQNGGSIVENYLRLIADNDKMIEDESFHIITVDSDQEIIQNVLSLYKQYYTDDPNTFQILTSVKKGDVGKNSLNTVISELRMKENPNILRKIGGYAVGDRIIMTRNNYDEGYWNGDVGVVTNLLPNGGYEAHFYDGMRIISPEAVLDTELAFVLTVHKSQGTEYNVIVLVLDAKYPSMLYKSLFLTAITRAKEKVFVIGQHDCVEKSIHTNKNAERVTGLCEMLLAYAV